MRKILFISFISIMFISCEKYDLETAYFHQINLELDFNLDYPDDNGGCDCFIHLVNNYQMPIDNIVITYEIQNADGESVKDYKTESAVNKVRIKSTEPFYVGDSYWTVVSDMVHNSTARFLKILDIEINFLK